MKRFTRYLIMLAAVFLAWIFTFSRPFRFFADMVHDAGHVLGALIAGFGLDAFGGGFLHGAISAGPAASGFQAVVIIAAAYLLTLGVACLLILASTGTIKKYIAGVTAIIVLIMILTCKYSDGSSEILYSVLFASAVILIFMADKDVLFKWLLEILAFSLFAFLLFDTLVYDILYELNGVLHFSSSWSRPASDPSYLQSATGMPAYAWSLILLAVIAAVFWSVARRQKRRRSPRGKNEST